MLSNYNNKFLGAKKIREQRNKKTELFKSEKLSSNDNFAISLTIFPGNMIRMISKSIMSTYYKLTVIIYGLKFELNGNVNVTQYTIENTY